MNQFVVSVFGGLTLGATYSLITLGLVLIFRTTGVFNVAHGQLMLLAAYVVADWEGSHHGSFWPGLLLGLAVTAAVAVLFYLLVLRWTVGLPHWIPFIATLVISQVMDAALAVRFGGSEYFVTLPHMPQGSFDILGGRVGKAAVITAAIGIALALIMIVGLRKTRLGTQVRAVGQDPVLASQGGIHVRRLYIAAWAVAGVLAAVAGVLYASTTLVNASLPDIALVAVPAMVLGGLDSFEGAVVGGLAIGIAQGFIVTYVGSQDVDVLTYSLLLLVLLVYPRGLFGSADVVKV
jgi:branched-chain amino acid transport system permease protein